MDPESADDAEVNDEEEDKSVENVVENEVAEADDGSDEVDLDDDVTVDNKSCSAYSA